MEHTFIPQYLFGPQCTRHVERGTSALQSTAACNAEASKGASVLGGKNGQFCVPLCIHTLCNMTRQLQSSRESTYSPLLESGMASDLLLARRRQPRWLCAKFEASSLEPLPDCVLGTLEPCPTFMLTSQSRLRDEETHRAPSPHCFS